MSDNISIGDLMKLVDLKKEDPEEYQRVIDGIMEVSRDILAGSMKLAKEMQDE